MNEKEFFKRFILFKYSSSKSYDFVTYEMSSGDLFQFNPQIVYEVPKNDEEVYVYIAMISRAVDRMRKGKILAERWISGIVILKRELAKARLRAWMKHD